MFDPTRASWVTRLVLASRALTPLTSCPCVPSACTCVQRARLFAAPCAYHRAHSLASVFTRRYAALARWAERFKHIYGREPTMWLDKACIDRKDLDVSLAYVPIYVRCVIASGSARCLQCPIGAESGRRTRMAGQSLPCAVADCSTPRERRTI